MSSNENESKPTSDEEDVRLMLRVKEGDEEALALLIGKHQDAVVGTVAKMLGSGSDAEDIAQQVFVRIWKSAKKYKPRAKFTTYMFTIMRNLVFNETRRRKIRKQVSIEEQNEEWGAQITDTQNKSPDEASLQSELYQAIDKAIANLPEKQRMAVILRRYENTSYDDIAKIVGLSVSAVKSQLFRARVTLKEELEQYLDQ